DYIKRVDKMLEVGAKVSYQRFSEDDQNESLRKVARNRSIQWLNNRVQLGKTTAEALKLCSSTSGSDEVCQARMHDVKAEATIVLVSIPIGATVTVDGISVGDAPVAVSMSHGAHTVGMTGPKGTVEHSITVGVDDATRWTWRSGEDRWESSF
ncbi:MAG: PEGA domain-containing protein, partial [Rhodobacterales bacterium]|nr:PEGA domain-containing protein [Rhodobacterales bacterium]